MARKVLTMSKQKYDPDYVKHGFIAIELRGKYLPQSVLCMKTCALRSNAAMKLNLLKPNLELNYAEKCKKFKVTLNG